MPAGEGYDVFNDHPLALNEGSLNEELSIKERLADVGADFGAVVSVALYV